MGKLIFGSLVGGVVLFAWSTVSWTVLTWHTPTLMKFRDEAAAKGFIEAATTESGVYVVPNGMQGTEDLSAEERKARFEEVEAEITTTGPFMFASVVKGPAPGMGQAMGIAFAVNVLTAGALTLLLLGTRIVSFSGRVACVFLVGLAVCLAGVAPKWIWWHFPTRFTLLDCADVLISFSLAGIFLALIVGRGSKAA